MSKFKISPAFSNLAERRLALQENVGNFLPGHIVDWHIYTAQKCGEFKKLPTLTVDNPATDERIKYSVTRALRALDVLIATAVGFQAEYTGLSSSLFEGTHTWPTHKRFAARGVAARDYVHAYRKATGQKNDPTDHRGACVEIYGTDFSVIGAGMFAIVLVGTGLPHINGKPVVFKCSVVHADRGPAYWAYAAEHPENPFCPVIHHHGYDKQRGWSWAISEKLDEITCDVRLDEVLDNPLAGSVLAWAKHLGEDDLHQYNVMQRDNGQYVINDPISMTKAEWLRYNHA